MEESEKKNNENILYDYCFQWLRQHIKLEPSDIVIECDDDENFDFLTLSPGVIKWLEFLEKEDSIRQAIGKLEKESRKKFTGIYRRIRTIENIDRTGLTRCDAHFDDDLPFYCQYINSSKLGSDNAVINNYEPSIELLNESDNIPNPISEVKTFVLDVLLIFLGSGLKGTRLSRLSLDEIRVLYSPMPIEYQLIFNRPKGNGNEQASETSQELESKDFQEPEYETAVFYNDKIVGHNTETDEELTNLFFDNKNFIKFIELLATAVAIVLVNGPEELKTTSFPPELFGESPAVCFPVYCADLLRSIKEKNTTKTYLKNFFSVLDIKIWGDRSGKGRDPIFNDEVFKSSFESFMEGFGIGTSDGRKVMKFSICYREDKKKLKRGKSFGERFKYHLRKELTHIYKNDEHKLKQYIDRI